MLRFEDLTPAGRVRRLRPLAGRALTEYAIGDHRLTLLADSFNTLFRVTTADAGYVLRIGPARRIHATGAARAEQRWTTELAGLGIEAPRLVASVDGAVSVVLDGAGIDGTRECSLLTWTPGRTLHRPPTDVDLHDLALLCARMHEASPPLASRPAGALDGQRALHFEPASALGSVDGRAGRTLRAALDRAQTGIDALWRDAAEHPRLIHSDLTPNNVVRHRTGLAAIDFQDLTWGHVQQDLANSIYGVTRGTGVEDAVRRFRAAYEQVRPWPSMTPALLDDLIAARRLEMVNLALTMRRPGLDAYLRGHVDALTAYLA